MTLQQAQEAFFAAEDAYCAYCSDATAAEYLRAWQNLANVRPSGWTLTGNQNSRIRTNCR